MKNAKLSIFWCIFLFYPKLLYSKIGCFQIMSKETRPNIVRSSWNFRTEKYTYLWVTPENFRPLGRWFWVEITFEIQVSKNFGQLTKKAQKPSLPLFNHSENFRDFQSIPEEKTLKISAIQRYREVLFIGRQIKV